MISNNEAHVYHTLLACSSKQITFIFLTRSQHADNTNSCILLSVQILMVMDSLNKDEENG